MACSSEFDVFLSYSCFPCETNRKRGKWVSDCLPVACLKSRVKRCNVLKHQLCIPKNATDLAFKPEDRCVKKIWLKSETGWIERPWLWSLETWRPPTQNVIWEWSHGALSGEISHLDDHKSWSDLLVQILLQGFKRHLLYESLYRRQNSFRCF